VAARERDGAHNPRLGLALVTGMCMRAGPPI
jgi:hypothetical protein